MYGYFLINKITAEYQAALVLKSLVKTAKAGLNVWSVTEDALQLTCALLRSLDASLTGPTIITKLYLHIHQR